MKQLLSTLMLALMLMPAQHSHAQDKRFEEWYFRTADSVDIYVKELSGGTEPVIVIHGGFGANHDYMLDALAGMDSKYHFILYDQRGSLMSPAPVSKLTFQRNVKDLHQLVKELGLTKVKLLCHSMGTLVGMEFLRLHPDMVETMVLLSGIPPIAKGPGEVFSDQVDANLEQLRNRPEAMRLKQPYEQRADKLTAKEKTELWRIRFAEGNIHDISKWRQVRGGRAYYKEEANIMTETVNWIYDYRDLLNEAHTTVLIGQYDFMDFNADKYRALISKHIKISLKVVPNAGHLAWIDNPSIFQLLLGKALARNSAGTQP